MRRTHTGQRGWGRQPSPAKSRCLGRFGHRSLQRQGSFGFSASGEASAGGGGQGREGQGRVTRATRVTRCSREDKVLSTPPSAWAAAGWHIPGWHLLVFHPTASTGPQVVSFQLRRQHWSLPACRAPVRPPARSSTTQPYKSGPLPVLDSLSALLLGWPWNASAPGFLSQDLTGLESIPLPGKRSMMTKVKFCTGPCKPRCIV